MYVSMEGVAVQNRPRRTHTGAQGRARNVNVTAAVGLEETAGSMRARRSSLFTQTVIWVTGLICTAFLLGAMAQAWSNSQIAQKVQAAQQTLQQVQAHHQDLQRQAQYYQNPAVIESEARQQLGYVRPGENPVVVISVSNASGTSKAAQQQQQSQQGFWQEWWHSLFGD